MLQDPDERELTDAQEKKTHKKNDKRKKFMQKLEEIDDIEEVSNWAINNNYKTKNIKKNLKFYQCAQLIKHTKLMSNVAESINWNKWQRYLLHHIQSTNGLCNYNDIFVVLNPKPSDQYFFASNFFHICNLLNTLFFDKFISSNLIYKLQNNPHTKNIIFNVNANTTVSNTLYRTINLPKDLKLLIKIIVLTHKALNWKYFETKRLKIMLIENETFTIRNYCDHITYINTNINKYYI